jgi:pyruvate carboxylase
LVDKEENIYFIEVNPRIQVEHTITEEITGVDIVRSQILIAKGHALDDPRIYIKSQEDVKANGFAIQCRITTEDPENGFKPDYGTIIAYRNAGGFGIRIDEGSSYAGVNISPFFDSMLVKVSSHGRTLRGAAQRLHRALREFRIRGVKTNIGFLENVISHPTFYNGECTVKFIDEHPDLFQITQKFDRGTKTLKFLADVSINGHPDVKFKEENKTFRQPLVPDYDKYGAYPKGTKNLLTDLGPEKFAQWLKNEKAIHYTDTTFRDAHQSLLATRMRGIDMMKVAEGYAKNNPEIFSMEVWGGATFDVCMRFLHENPWERLAKFRRAMPNILLQMLLRGSNAVGYKAYPDNLIEKFIEKSAETGIDVFRIFDSLNWLEAMKVSIKTVRERTNSIAEAAICYTGDILDPKQKKYTLDYYVDFAKQLENEGAHIIAIKDMAGLLKPYAASELISALKSEINLPIHLHTHDTSSIQSATYLKAIEAGVDVVDVAMGSMSGLTSQPNFNSVASYMQGHEREQKLNINSLNDYSTYWEYVRELYYPFESGLKAGTAEIYDNEIPGGQYSNLRPQANALGLGDKFETVKKNYALVNKMFGDLVKVTPSSKVVGDMALFMTSNNLTPNDVFEKGHTLSFPDSVVDLFRGELGQPVGGFPKELSKIILKGEKPFTDKPNKHLEPVDFKKEMEAFKKKFDGHDNELDLLAYLLYPKVYEDFYKHQQQFGEVGYIPTLAFFYGMKNGEEILVEISEGKTIIIKLLYISEPNEEALRTVAFELNGQTRRVKIKDNSAKVDKVTNRKISEENEVGAPLQGKLASIKVKPGDEVTENTALFVIEAMKMESSITPPRAGVVKEVHLKAGDMVQQDDLVVSLE